MSSLYDFFVEWRHRSNPWREAYREGGGVFERSFLIFTIYFIGLNQFGIFVGRKYGKPFSSRPTFFAGTANALLTSIVAIYLLAFRVGCDDEGSLEGCDFTLWREVALPFSIAYFVVDLIYYCLPKKDMLTTFHHIIMIFCHYPVGHEAGAILCGAGDKQWVSWISTIGYTSEVATILMNYRWYLLQTLEQNWIGFAMVNISIVISWAARVVLFAYLLIFEIAPRFSLYIEEKQILTYSILVAGHFIIGVLSLYWLSLMCRGGIRGLTVFKKPKSGNFQFGGDIGRDEQDGFDKQQPTKSDSAQALSPIKRSVAEESKAWVDGTLYDKEEVPKKSL